MVKTMMINASSAATALVVACLASAAVGLALCPLLDEAAAASRTAGRLRAAARGAVDLRQPLRRQRLVQPETPGVSNAPPSFEDHANPMRGGYEAPGIEDPEGWVVSSLSHDNCDMT